MHSQPNLWTAVTLFTQLTLVLLNASSLVVKKLNIYTTVLNYTKTYGMPYFLNFKILQVQRFIYFPTNYLRYTYDSW
jgi:hypothetical protein